MPVTQVITSLGTPPQTSDPTNFDARADALLGPAPGGLPNLVTELNIAGVQITAAESNAIAQAAAAASSAAAAQALAGAVAFNAGTTYLQYQASISTVNLLTYRRKTAGSSATDPSADSTNWVNTGLPPVILVRTAVNFTAVAGTTYILTANDIQMLLMAAPGAQDVVTYRLGVGVSRAVLKGNGNSVEGQTIGVDVNVDIAGFRGRILYNGTDGYMHF